MRPHIKTIITAAIAVSAMICIISGGYAKYSYTAAETHYKEHVVGPDDTIYSIAVKYRPGEDWRDVAREIERENRITPLIHAGQVVRVRVK